jgi:NAD(P)-dependent dehydrogenase (short-subunit alcohol dehydrogenase family)
MGRVVIPFSGAYTSSKYALEALTEGYRYELAPAGVDVTLIEPGGFASNYWSKLMSPQDQDRANSYGALAETPNKFWAGISGMMQSEQAPSPQIVADAILNLIETPVGQRSFRTVVDPVTGGAGPAAINQVSSEIQSQLLEAFGLKDLLSIQEI